MVKAVKKAKNVWLQEKAKGMLCGGSHGSTWKRLRELQQGRVGLRPVRTRIIKKANGDPCKSVDESVNCWREHFCQVLNVQSRRIRFHLCSQWLSEKSLVCR